MKMIMAIIKPYKLEDVREALIVLGVEGFTVSEVKGFGRQRGQPEFYRGAEYTVSFQPKIKIELAVSDEHLEAALITLQNAASTGRIGDGKIFVYDLHSTVRIRTGESGKDAL